MFFSFSKMTKKTFLKASQGTFRCKYVYNFFTFDNYNLKKGKGEGTIEQGTHSACPKISTSESNLCGLLSPPSPTQFNASAPRKTDLATRRQRSAPAPTQWDGV